VHGKSFPRTQSVIGHDHWVGAQTRRSEAFSRLRFAGEIVRGKGVLLAVVYSANPRLKCRLATLLWLLPCRHQSGERPGSGNRISRVSSLNPGEMPRFLIGTLGVTSNVIGLEASDDTTRYIKQRFS